MTPSLLTLAPRHRTNVLKSFQLKLDSLPCTPCVTHPQPPSQTMLLAVTPTVESGMLFLGDWREAFEDTAWFGTEEAVVELVVLGTKR